MLAKQSASFTKVFKSYSSALLSLVFPNLCVVCANNLLQKEKFICRLCEQKLPYTHYHQMPSNAVERIFWGRVPIEHAASLIFYRKGEVSQKILAAIKYKGQTELGERMGEQMGVTLKETSWWNDIDCIVPVPLHPRKLRQRGFNQCDSIAKGLSRSTGIPVDNQIIFRQAYTETQTRKGRFDRFTNMSSAFAVCPSHNARNKHVLLIDDVVTTGGTLEACSNQLRSIPNMKVSIYTLAYASQ